MDTNPYLNEKEKQILSSVKIGIAGAGGLGSNSAMHLIRSGIINLKIIDFDIVAPSNLNRQFFFKSQIGQPKVHALKNNLLAINPDAHIEIYQQKVTSENVTSLFADCELVIEAFDIAECKNMLIHSLLPLKKIIIAASGLAGWGKSNLLKVTQVGKFLYLIGDGLTEVGHQTNNAPASPRVGIVAAMQANTAIAILLKQEV